MSVAAPWGRTLNASNDAHSRRRTTQLARELGSAPAGVHVQANPGAWGGQIQEHEVDG